MVIQALLDAGNTQAAWELGRQLEHAAELPENTAHKLQAAFAQQQDSEGGGSRPLVSISICLPCIEPAHLLQVVQLPQMLQATSGIDLAGVVLTIGFM